MMEFLLINLDCRVQIKFKNKIAEKIDATY